MVETWLSPGCPPLQHLVETVLSSQVAELSFRWAGPQYDSCCPEMQITLLCSVVRPEKLRESSSLHYFSFSTFCPLNVNLLEVFNKISDQKNPNLFCIVQRLKVQNEGSTRFGFSRGLPSWPVGGHPLPVSLGSPPANQGPALITSFSFDYFIKGPISSDGHTGD